MLRVQASSCLIRSWRAEDANSLAAHANDRLITRNTRDRFPHPYTLDHAVAFIERTLASDPEDNFAIDVAGEAVGGIGFSIGTDVERIGAEIGYWLGTSHWGKGIATDAVRAVTEYAMQTHDLKRVFAIPFAGNAASVRVLEKAGYVLEGRMRKSALKDGQVIDQLLFAFVDDALP